MKRLILIVLCFISSGVSGQSREEQWRLLDPRNYANGMTFVDDCELQVRGADISEYDLLDTGEIVVVYRFRHPFLQKTRPSVADGELMVLEIGSRISAFYSQDLYITDSLYTILVQRKNPRGMSSHSVRHIVYRDRVKHRFEVVERMPFHSGEAIIIEDSGGALLAHRYAGARNTRVSLPSRRNGLQGPQVDCVVHTGYPVVVRPVEIGRVARFDPRSRRRRRTVCVQMRGAEKESGCDQEISLALQANGQKGLVEIREKDAHGSLLRIRQQYACCERKTKRPTG